MSAPVPYFGDGTVTLYLGDCREVLPALGVTPDCIVADPPYGETSLAWDRWPDGWLDIAATVTRSLWCFGSLRMYLEHAGEFQAAWKLSQDIIWEKQNGSGFATDRFKRVHEQVTHWYRGSWGTIHHDVPREAGAPRSATIYRSRAGGDHLGQINPARVQRDSSRMALSIVRARNLQGRAIAPTQKPTGLLEPMIAYACPPGGLVVDPFAGSGSTLMAARMTGRRAIGIELHEPQAEEAARWLCQGDLFGGAGA